MSDRPLEPRLTRSDLRVLRAFPPDSEEFGADPAASASLWQVGERLDQMDLGSLLLTVLGLHHLGYLHQSTSRSRKCTVWWRTSKGDEAA